MKTNTSPEREKRLAIVNQIIADIALRGRRFFYSKKTDTNAMMSVSNGRVYYHCEFTGKKIYLNVPDYRKGKGWQHGGTCWALVKDFRDYILAGGDTNHKHGYGGLYCPHWGYPPEDMKAIQSKAIELGYLTTKGTP